MPIPTSPPTALPCTPVVAVVPRRASWQLRIAHAALYATARKFFLLAVWLDAHTPIPPRSLLWVARIPEPLLRPLRPIRGTRLRRVQLADCRAEWVWHRNQPDPGQVPDSAILYLHGGGLVACGLNSHRRLVSRIAHAAGVPVLNVDYRQIPRVHVTDTVEDCVGAYEYLLAQGFPAERIVLAGDSAGGGLIFSLAAATREHGLPMPAGIAAISPWADYDSTARLAHPNDRTEALLPARAYALPVKWGMAIDGFLDPAWSPVNHRFDGLPPTLIQVSSTEVVRSDAERLAQRCAAAGVPVSLQIWDRAVHVFHAGADIIPDAREAIAHVGAFIRDQVDSNDQRNRAIRTTA